MDYRKDVKIIYYYNSNNEEKTYSNSGDYFFSNSQYKEYIVKKNNKVLSHNLINIFKKKLKKLYKRLIKYNNKYKYFLELQLIKRIKTFNLKGKEKSFTDILYSINIKILDNNTEIIDAGYGSINNTFLFLFSFIKIMNIVKMLSIECENKFDMGYYDVILDQEATGILVHETIGHCLEADTENEIFNKFFKKKICNSKITIIDDPQKKYRYGYYKFDDEFVKSKKVILVKKGILNGIMLNKKYASILKMENNGHARTTSFKHEPIVRMSNTYMKNGIISKRKLFSTVKNGIYLVGCCNSVGGSNYNITFRFAFLIENGKIVKRLPRLKSVGNTIELLEKIEMIANDCRIYGGGLGGCNKKNQNNLEVSSGGPHIKIKNIFLMKEK